MPPFIPTGWTLKATYAIGNTSRSSYTILESAISNIYGGMWFCIPRHPVSIIYLHAPAYADTSLRIATIVFYVMASIIVHMVSLKGWRLLSPLTNSWTCGLMEVADVYRHGQATGLFVNMPYLMSPWYAWTNSLHANLDTSTFDICKASNSGCYFNKAEVGTCPTVINLPGLWLGLLMVLCRLDLFDSEQELVYKYWTFDMAVVAGWFEALVILAQILSLLTKL